MTIRHIIHTVLFALTEAALAEPVTSAFTYHGRLDYNGAPASGSYDLKFELFTVANGGAPVARAVERPAQNISGGLFTVDLEFGGPARFDGTAYWLATLARVAGEGSDIPVPERVAKATDHDKAQGANIGKAITTLGEGEGDVLVLVTLQ